MRVRMGWSGETESGTWQKVDVELEQEDLQRLCRENGLPDDLHERIPTRACFAMVQNEAEMLLLNKLKQLGYPQDKADARIAALLSSSAELISLIKAQLQPA